MLKIKINKTQLKKLYIEENRTRKEISNICHCCEDTIKDRLEFGIEKNVKYKNLSIEKILKYAKGGMAIRDIASKCNCSNSLIKRKLKEFNATLKKEYYVDNSYFKTWNCGMAYLIGIIMTDGCVRDKRRELTIVSIDDELTDFFTDQLKTNYKISKSKQRCSFAHVYSREIVDDLMKMGIVPRKSNVLSLSKVPDSKMDIYFWDILRGIIDGDGCIQKPNKRSIRINICSGSKIFLEQILDILIDVINCPEYKIIKKKGAKTYYLNINGEYAYKCLDNMYNNGKFAIKRKKLAALESMRAFENKKSCGMCGREMRFSHFSRKYCSACRGGYVSN